MANVQHSTLTGASLHEPKGVAAASANRVYVADGAGSGSWTTVSNDVLATSAKAFQGSLLHIQHTTATNVAGGTATSGSFLTRTLDTVATNEISGASLGSNQITLPSGTYWLDGYSNYNIVNSSQTRFRNITDGTTTLVGACGYFPNGVSSGTVGALIASVPIRGRFTIAAQKVFELQYRVETTNNTDGLGLGFNSGETLVHADLCIWKIA